ncbi:MAG: hypothetical protein JXR83_02940 [Deltaproteobacteria bacterium]|nr:hypothetical protein [Deltaproteobacteria bacterium]
MSNDEAPIAPRPDADKSDPPPKQSVNWLSIVGFCTVTAAIIAVAYYLLM